MRSSEEREPIWFLSWMCDWGTTQLNTCLTLLIRNTEPSGPGGWSYRDYHSRLSDDL